MEVAERRANKTKGLPNATQEPRPPCRQPGRPRGRTPLPDSASVSEPTVNNDEPGPIRRAPGRPRGRTPLPDSASVPAADNREPGPIRRPRGRPRGRTPLPASASVGEPVVDDEEHGTASPFAR